MPSDCLHDKAHKHGLWAVVVVLVQALVEAGPFWPTGLRKSVRIMKWQQTYANGYVLVRHSPHSQQPVLRSRFIEYRFTQRQVPGHNLAFCVGQVIPVQ